MLEKLRNTIYSLHQELPRNHLVTWTSGNVSGRDPETGHIVIKPSGVSYDLLSPESLVIVSLDGQIVEGGIDRTAKAMLKPSTDTESHLVVYRNRPEIHGIVHTHSPYATAWAATGESIPCILTAMADEFGGPIPCGHYARIGGDAIGKAILEGIGYGPAILLRNHGVFTVGPDPKSAVKAAVMVEDVARTAWLAMMLSRTIGDVPLCPLPADEIQALHTQYTNVYGQPK